MTVVVAVESAVVLLFGLLHGTESISPHGAGYSSAMQTPIHSVRVWSFSTAARAATMLIGIQETLYACVYQ